MASHVTRRFLTTTYNVCSKRSFASKPSDALVKKHKYTRKTTGMIEKSLSPYEQSVVAPVFKNFAEKGINRVKNNFWDVAPAIALLYVCVAGGNKISSGRRTRQEIDRMRNSKRKRAQTVWSSRRKAKVVEKKKAEQRRKAKVVEKKKAEQSANTYRCVQIIKPGGYEVLELVEKEDPAGEVGPNVKLLEIDTSDLVSVDVFWAGVNYADVCIRWGLYSSANKFSSYPLTPGFEFSGVVLNPGPRKDLHIGDKVFGVSMFGAYTSRISVPSYQVFKIPSMGLSMREAAGFPAVSLTAFHAIKNLASVREGYDVLIHSAAGGVGSMLVQLAKAMGARKIVGVVGASHKIATASETGCTHVIDKSLSRDDGSGSSSSWWNSVDEIAPNGFDAVFDANGVSTLRDSYDRLRQGGRLIVFGFHSMLPKRGGRLGIWQWVKMAYHWLRSPTFDPLAMVPQNRSVMGFNLSYLFDEKELLETAMEYLLSLCSKGKLRVSRVTPYALSETAKAHRDIESGMTVGKLVLDCRR